MLYSFMWVIPRRLNTMCRRFGTLSFIFNIITYEDGTDKVFRNVGTQNSDAGKSIKRKNKTFKTRRKFETRKEGTYCYIVFCGLLRHLQGNASHYHASVYNSFHPFIASRYVIFVSLDSILSCIEGL